MSAKRLLPGLLVVPAALAVCGIGYVAQVKASGREMVLRWEPGGWRFGRGDTQEASARITRVGNRVIQEKPHDETFVLGPLEVGARRWVRF